ncbi:hypothetical protein Tco_0736667, partial [Tanacetum coccineum]
MERAATTASSLEAEHDSGSGPMCQATILGGVDAQTRFETTSKKSNDLHLSRVYTLGSGEDSMQLMELMAHCTKLTLEDGEVEITATIDGQLKTITEASLRRHLMLEDDDGISSLPNTEIFEQFALMGHASDSDKLTFQKGLTIPVKSHHTPITTPSTSQPPFSSPSRVPTPPYDSPLLGGHTPRSDEGIMTLNELTVLCTQLSTKVASLEQDLKQTKKAYDLEDPSKQRRRIAEIDQNPSILLIQDEGTSCIQEDAEIQGRTSVDTEILLDQEEPTELVEDLGSGEKGEKEISIANISVSTASATPEVSTASATPEVSTTAENLVYIKRSAEKRKDKGKAIMKEDDFINEEESQRIARDAEIAKQLQEEINIPGQEEVVAKDDEAHDIDWSDSAVIRYHSLQNRSFSKAEVRKNMCVYLKNQGEYKQSYFKGMKYEDIRPIFERVWDQNHAFVPKDSEIEKEVLKRPGFDFLQKSIKKNDDRQQQAGSSKKRSGEDSDEDN